MLFPNDRPVFENVSSNEYFLRAGQLKDGKFDGVFHFTFSGFEEAILFSEGRPVTGIHEAKRWLTVGDGLVEVVENKAMVASGRMSAYRLDPAVLQVFMHKGVKSMVETKLGKYLTPALLINYLLGDLSTGVLKFTDEKATAYVFLLDGKRAGAAYNSPEGRSFGESAVKDMARFKENTAATIYFMESVVKPKVEAPATPAPAVPVPGPVAKPQEAPAIETAKSIAPPAPAVEPTRPPAPAPAGIKAKPKVAAPIESIAAVRPRLAKPLPIPDIPKPSGIRLSVAMSQDDIIGLRHRSRQHTMETLEEGDVAWVDARTLASLRTSGQRVSIVLPGGREYPVALKEAAIEPVENRFIILPRKLRTRLALDRGMTIEVKE